MKINNSPSQTKSQKSIQGNEELRKKLEEKFGKTFSKKEEKKDEVEVSDKAKKKNESDAVKVTDNFGDIKKNNPNDDSTKEKLKSILRTGAFSFNDKERSALKNILGD